jgi:hypothetical protein
MKPALVRPAEFRKYCAARSTDKILPANNPEFFAVTPGQVLNFISTSTSTGYVVLTEMT